MDKDAVQSASVTFTDGTGAVTGASFMALTKPEFRFYTSGISETQGYDYNRAGVSAENMDKKITVTVTGLGTITFNGNAFAKAKAKSSNTAQSDLGAALYNYGLAAKSCFGA